MSKKPSAITGTLEAALFMPSCARAFDGRIPALKRSFLIPFTIFPLSALLFISAHPEAAMGGAAQATLFGVYALRFAVYMVLFFGAVHILSNKLHKGRDFLRFVQAHNWMELPAFIVSLPLCLGYWAGAYEWAEIYPMLVIATLYGYAALAYVAARIFALPLDLGITIAAFALVLSQTSLGAVKFGVAQAMLWLA